MAPFSFLSSFSNCPFGFAKNELGNMEESKFKFVISSKSFKKIEKPKIPSKKKNRFWLTSIIIHEKNNEIPRQGVLDAQQKCDSES